MRTFEELILEKLLELFIADFRKSYVAHLQSKNNFDTERAIKHFYKYMDRYNLDRTNSYTGMNFTSGIQSITFRLRRKTGNKKIIFSKQYEF